MAALALAGLSSALVSAIALFKSRVLDLAKATFPYRIAHPSSGIGAADASRALVLARLSRRSSLDDLPLALGGVATLSKVVVHLMTQDVVKPQSYLGHQIAYASKALVSLLLVAIALLAAHDPKR